MSNQFGGSDNELLIFFKALADETRLKVIGLLAHGPQTTEQLAERLGLRAPTVSHHLEKLLVAGLVRPEPTRGHAKPYALRLDALHEQAGRLLGDASTLVELAPGPLEADAYEREIWRNFSNPDGTLKEIPAQRKKLNAILARLVCEFAPGEQYSEKQVNALLKRFHPDTASLRRELIGARLMQRDRGIYTRVAETS
ncbi:MAG TPA: metalloregulator ArsR/SmtB family transcription factor [Anaerolineales bacterium]|nr:metalloregulator ArsR/SmtB family transcription factor [Anaerolineales bacterium]HRF47274.1 metalloregulator ArsR/SmtB family transcription factor [Anaerolineales bacterium]